MHQSIATIKSPEFINLQPLDINPLMSKCEIKVLYLGENRNKSYISKDVAMEMAKTLRGAPIVGYYREDKEDFADHGERIIFDDEGIKFDCLTKPYGFVSPDAQVWFQEFEDTDDFGNTVKKEYLMTTGYIWTGQFEEAKSVIENGKNQSMELQEETLKGEWTTDNQRNMDFFIINDAVFSKLCILGDDVEPCFEGARVTKPEVSSSFSKVDDTFKKTLYGMMQDLKFALEGGISQMENETNVTEVAIEETTPVVEEIVAEETEEKVVEEATTEENAVVEEVTTEEEESTETVPTSTEETQTEEKEENTEFSLLKEENETLKAQYAELESKYAQLVEFKNQVEDKEKDELIKSFYMLSDEDKKDVIENKSKYSKDDIEAKLSVICFRKKVNFDLDDSSKNEEEIETEEKEENVTTFALESKNIEVVPAWISAVRNTKNSNK